MSEERWAEIWRDQPAGEAPMDVRQLERRGSELKIRTRREILTSVAAAMLFVGVMWRRVPSLWVGAALVWALITLLWFRGRLRQGALRPGATGVDHYRHELERRRDHLRNIWIWNGPLLAACITLAAVVDVQRLPTVAPLLIALAAWTIYGVVRRRRQANDIQRELDELAQSDPRS